MNIQRLNKKGVLGLDTAKEVFVWFLVLAVLGITIILALTSLRAPVEEIDKSTTTFINQTTSNMNSTAIVINDTERNCAMTLIGEVTYEENLSVIDPGNYSIINRCSLNYTGVASSPTENTNWNISGSYTYSNPETNLIITNITSALSNNFFNQTGTIFAIIIVVVIILAISIIIAVVTRFSGGGGGGGFGSDTVTG